MSTRAKYNNRCRKTVELHDGRHREIATIIRKIQGIDETLALASASVVDSRIKRKTRKSDVNDQKAESDWADTSITCDERKPKQSDAAVHGNEEKGADKSTACQDHTDAKRLHTSRTDGNRSTKKAKQVEKQTKRDRISNLVITTEYLKRLDEALHPTHIPLGEWPTDNHHRRENPLVNNSTIDANITFNAHTFKYSSLRQPIHAKRQAREDATPKAPSKGTTLLDDRAMVLIFSKLDISMDISPSSKERTTLITQLTEAIHEDLTIFANDERETMMRMAGYWRYANRHTYNTMVRNNELWDWSTGQKSKLEEIQEDEEVEPKDQGSGPGERNISGTPSKVQAVENYDQDFELGAEKPGLVVTEADDAVNFTRAYEGFRDGRSMQRRQQVVLPSTDVVLPVPITPKRQSSMNESGVRFETAIEAGRSLKDTPCQVDKKEAHNEDDEEEEEQQSTGIWSTNRFAALADPNLLPEVEKKAGKKVPSCPHWPPITPTRSNKSQKKSRKIGYYNTLSKGL